MDNPNYSKAKATSGYGGGATEPIWHKTLDALPAAVVAVDWEGTIKFWNRRATQLYGYCADKMLGDSVGWIAPDFDVSTLHREIAESEDKVVHREYRHHHPSHGMRSLQCRISFLNLLEAGAPEGFLLLTLDVSQEKEFYGEMRRVQHRFRTAMELARLGYYEIWLPGQELEGDRNYYRLYDVPARERDGTTAPILERIHPEDRPRLLERMKQAYQGHRQGITLHRIRTQQGELRYLQGNASPEIDEGGRVVRVFGFVQDVTDITFREMEARRHAEELERLHQAVGLHFFALRPGEQELRCSPAFCGLLGMPARGAAEPSKGQALHCIAPEDRFSLLRALARVWRGHQLNGMEVRIRSLDQPAQWIWISAHPVRNPEGQIVEISCFAQDITTIREREQAHNSLKRKLELTSEAGGVAFWEFWPALGLLKANGVINRWLDHARHERFYPAGEALRKLPRGTRMALLRQALRSVREGRSMELSFRFQDVAGKERFVKLLGEAARDEDQEVESICGIAIEYTAFVEYEQRLRHSYDELTRAQAELEAINRDTTHGLRSPLSALLGMLDTLLQPDEAQEAVAITTLQCIHRRLVGLDKNVQNLFHLQQNKRAEVVELPLHPAELAQRVLQECRESPFFTEAAQVEVYNHIPESLTLEGDGYRLHLILSKLIENAFQYFDPLKPRHWVCLEAQESLGELWLDVVDNGPGIAAGDRERIFELYTRCHRRSEGSGMGLYVAYAAAQAVRGAVELVATSEAGSRFRLRVPRRL